MTAAILLAAPVAITHAESPSDRQDRNLPEYTLVQEPEPTESEQQTVAQEITPVRAGLTMRATHYGESYNGQRMGCPGAGAYDSADLSILAVSPSRYRDWPCGTRLLVRGPQGRIVVVRQDACPGCDKHGWPEMIDLSEAGHAAVCGIGTCVVTVEVVE